MSKHVYRPRRISGFPEWLPEVRLIELSWLDTIRRVFESFGFSSIETSSVEELGVIEAKGEDADKEIYTIKRLKADPSDTSDSRLALHYDLTVPLARYVALNFNELVFPFKRYQIQKVWRGERPQEGRYREFYQADIDVINLDHVPLYFDAEMPAIVYDIYKQLNIGDFRILISNRKVLQGFLNGLGIEDVTPVIRTIDKLEKIGEKQVSSRLEEHGVSREHAILCMQVAQIKTTDSSFADKIRKLGVNSNTLDEGLHELAFVMDYLSRLPEGSVVADLSIARGFDYYTGTVYEAQLTEFPAFGSICSGGRYDDLASSFINKKLPGVGISIGTSRILAKLLAEGRLPIGPKSPTQVLVTWMEEGQFEAAANVAATLRRRGINTELYYTNEKVQKQLRYASRKGISYVWFLPFAENEAHQVKNLNTGVQIDADPEQWIP
jgi:histidyl-tRNA synthetase